jgi:diacylglycerol kinase
MLEPEKFSVRKRFKSFVFAFSGVKYFFRREHNAWIHALATIVVLILSAVMHISLHEMIALIFCIALVWITEMLNTSIEKLMDHLAPHQHPDVKLVKDVAAAAVLVAAIAAAIIGLIIFIPKFL